VAPSPKSHDQDVGSPVDVSVNATFSGANPVVGLLMKFAVRYKLEVETWMNYTDLPCDRISAFW
jgi:hypothetical protein